MNLIKIYLEFHWGRRRPNLGYFLNHLEISPQKVTSFEIKSYQENLVVELPCDIDRDNLLEVKMSDKTDNDLLSVNQKEFIDHWVKIREIEIDDIKAETAMYNACEFQHCMDVDWVSRMSRQGYDILPVYKGGTDIRLNGTWSMHFSSPFWQWCVLNYG